MCYLTDENGAKNTINNGAKSRHVAQAGGWLTAILEV